MKFGLLLFLFLITAKSVFTQELAGNPIVNQYINNLKEEGYELVTQGSFTSGVLPKEVSLGMRKSYKYRIIAIPTGKLKTVRMNIGNTLVPSSSKNNPVLDWTYVPYGDENIEIEFLHPKKRRGRFKLSSEDSIFYVIGKKPF